MTEQYHGHRIVAGDELQAVFEPDEQVDQARRGWHRLHRIVISVLALLVIIALTLAVLVWRGVITLPAPASSAVTAASCPTTSFEYPANLSIKLRVFNTTSRSGLAASVAAELKKRGYQVTAVADGQIKTAATSTAVIVSGLAGQAAAYNLQQNLPGTEYRGDDRKDNSVDVYLAAGFTALTKAGAVNHAAGRLRCAAPGAADGTE